MIPSTRILRLCIVLALGFHLQIHALDLDAIAAGYSGLPNPSAAQSNQIPSPAREATRLKESKPPKATTQKVSAGKQAWDQYEKTIGVPLRKWASEEIAPTKGGTVFYPFSGPDFVTVAQMFPDADRYVLVAIQPAGPMVDPGAMSTGAAAEFRTKFGDEWAKFGALGFFRTNDLNENTTSGTCRLTATPVMMAFAGAVGFHIGAVRPLKMNEASHDFEPSDVDAGTKWSSVRVDLTKDERSVTLDYICLDLSDSHLKKHPEELGWIQNMAKNPVLLKAASHLLPKPYFSACRNAIVAGSPLLVQDETGLEFPDLKKMGEVKLYGRFAGVLKLFDQNSQLELVAAYKAAGQTSALPFACSYQKSADRRCFQIVRRVQAQ
jgi:hypothetical protein